MGKRTSAHRSHATRPDQVTQASHENGSQRDSCAVCWLPNLIVYLLDFYGSQIKRGDILHTTAVALVTLNSTVNPIIYCFQSERFRTCVKALVFTPCSWRRRAMVEPKISTNGTDNRGCHGKRQQSNLHPTHTA